VGFKVLKSLNLTNGYPNKNNNKVKSKPLELRSRVKTIFDRRILRAIKNRDGTRPRAGATTILNVNFSMTLKISYKLKV
jgi:hypothetical protein